MLERSKGILNPKNCLLQQCVQFLHGMDFRVLNQSARVQLEDLMHSCQKDNCMRGLRTGY